jgi:arylamine N-acetyltransferase
MKSPLLTVLPLAICCAAASAAEVYKWTDSSGHTVYSDQPPPAAAGQAPVKPLSLKVSPPAAQKTASAPLGKIAASQPAAAKKVENENAQIRAQNCQRARYNASVLQQRLNDLKAANGTKAANPTAQMEAVKQMTQTQQDIAANCGKS